MIKDEYIQQQLNKAEVLGLEQYKIPVIPGGSYVHIVVHNTKEGHSVYVYVPSDVESITTPWYDCSELKLLIEGKVHGDPNSIQSVRVIGGSGLVELSKTFYDFKYKELNIEDLDTSEVRHMDNAFADCSSRVIGIEKLNTHNVRNMVGTFKNFGSREIILDISNLDTSNVKYMMGMFSRCHCKIIGLDKISTENAVNMSKMFEMAILSHDIDLSNFSVDALNNIDAMFNAAIIHGSVNASNLKLNNLKSAKIAFNNALIYNLNLENTVISPYANMEGIFSEYNDTDDIEVMKKIKTIITDKKLKDKYNEIMRARGYGEIQ